MKDLTGLVTRDEGQYIGGGAFGDVYRGVWNVKANGAEGASDELAQDEEGRPEVVVKVLRSTGSIDPKSLTKRLKVSTSPALCLSLVIYSLHFTRSCEEN